MPPALSLKTQHQITTPDKFLVSKLLNKADPNNGEMRSSTPIAQVAQTAAEVADTASALDNVEILFSALTHNTHADSRRRTPYWLPDSTEESTKTTLQISKRLSLHTNPLVVMNS